jgi:type IV secretion system protein VirD4
MGRVTVTGAMNTALTFINLVNALTPPAPPELPYVPPPNPMDGMATLAELARYRLTKSGFYLGDVHDDHGLSFPAGIDDDRHIFIKAGTRAGKGISLCIPNALLWRGPLFMIDPKGEGASIAAMRRATREAAQGTGTNVRHFVGQQVAVLDPLGEVRGPARALRVAYNPLADIDLRQGGGVRAINAAAAALVTPEEGNGAHFAETAETIIAGLIEAVKVTEPPERQTLTQCRAIMLAGFDTLRAYLSKVETRAGLALEAAALMDEVGGDEWGSHRSTLSRNMKWLAEPAMQEHLVGSAFSLRRAVQEGWSVFVSLPPDDIPYFKGWIRLIVQTVIDAKMSLGVGQAGLQTLCLLDEFPTLGRFRAIEDSAGYMAGYGLKLVPIIQNIGQVKAHYAKNWETFLGNAGAIVAFGLNDDESEQYMATRLGRKFVTEATRSLSTGSGGQAIGGSANFSENWSTARHERPIRFPNEIREQGARETMRAFVVPASGRGFTIRRRTYMDFDPATYDSPAHIADWERRFWR